MADRREFPTDVLLPVAEALAEVARAETLAYFRGAALATENKAVGGFDPVTAGDRAAEAAMRAILEERRPSDGILGEEFGPKPSETGITWVLDPIDGTRAFLAGAPTWGVLIAASDANGPGLGLIDQPYIGERFIGYDGTARCIGPMGARDLSVRHTARIEDAILLSTFPEIGTVEEHAAFTRVATRCRLVRYGLDCYAYALLAAGQVDLVIEAGLFPYDIHAPMAVIEAAGGIVTTWEGGPATEGGRILAAATPELHAQAMDLLAGR